jgi:hypothetical protein
MRTPIPHPGKQLLFALLSVADLSLTWWLLNHSDGYVGEGNPVARWWLERHGWLGLAGFKAAGVLLVAALAAVISRRRPRAGGRVLALGCAALAGVVLFSASLCGRMPELVAAWRAEDERELAEFNRQTREEFRRREAYQALVREVDEGLASGAYTLREAVGRVGSSEGGRDPVRLRRLRHLHPGRPAPECLAASLILYAVSSRATDPAAARRLARRLEREFRSTFGTPPPREHRVFLAPQGGEGRPGLPRPGRRCGRPAPPRPHGYS